MNPTTTASPFGVPASPMTASASNSGGLLNKSSPVSTGTSMFGSGMSQSSPFGNSSPAFSSQASSFGGSTSLAFGGSQVTTFGGIPPFGSQSSTFSSQPATFGSHSSSFGSQPTASGSQSSSFGSQSTVFGSQNSSFGSQTLFGATSSSQVPVSIKPFGSGSGLSQVPVSMKPFGSDSFGSGSGLGQQTPATTASPFSSSSSSSTSMVFGGQSARLGGMGSGLQQVQTPTSFPSQAFVGTSSNSVSPSAMLASQPPQTTFSGDMNTPVTSTVSLFGGELSKPSSSLFGNQATRPSTFAGTSVPLTSTNVFGTFGGESSGTASGPGNPFGSAAQSNVFGSRQNTKAVGAFNVSQSHETSRPTLFPSKNKKASGQVQELAKSSSSGGLFGSKSAQGTELSKGFPSGGLFGAKPPSPIPGQGSVSAAQSGSLFGAMTSPPSAALGTGQGTFPSAAVFGAQASSPDPNQANEPTRAFPTGAALFGAKTTTVSSNQGIGQSGTHPSAGLFGAKTSTSIQGAFASGNVFGAKSSTPSFSAGNEQGKTFPPGGMFGAKSDSSSPGQSIEQTMVSSVFGEKTSVPNVFASKSSTADSSSFSTNVTSLVFSQPAASVSLFVKSSSDTSSAFPSSSVAAQSGSPVFGGQKTAPAFKFVEGNYTLPEKPKTVPVRQSGFVKMEKQTGLFEKPSGAVSAVKSESFVSTKPSENLFDEKHLRSEGRAQASQNLFGNPQPTSSFGKNESETEVVTSQKLQTNLGKDSSIAPPSTFGSTAFGAGSSLKTEVPPVFAPKPATNLSVESRVVTGQSSNPPVLFGKTQEVPSPATSSESLPTRDGASDVKDQTVRSQTLSKWSRPRESQQVYQPSTSSRRLSASKAGATPSKSSRTQLLSSRRSTEDLKSKTTLIVRQIPTHLCNKDIMRSHFSQFGRIMRLTVTPQNNSAVVNYDSHASALKAKTDGKNIEDGSAPLSIFFRAAKDAKSPEIKSATRKANESLPKPTPGSVEEELQSMVETTDYNMPGGLFDEPVAKEPMKTASSKARVSTKQRSQTPPPSSSRTTVRQRSPTLPAPQTSSAATTDKSLFKELFRAKAKDTAERIVILDKRDKLLRLLRGRQQSDLATAKAFIGNCPDMCPEKERYYREDIRRLALFEIIPSTISNTVGVKTKVDHAKAVKEYSRSSADQEEPLSHELRPLNVLESTMVYLLTEVADTGRDDRWSEWYDFLWNRTRGIRKDITQQRLCNIEVAELMEKCARFHIFSSERLCEEDMMTFDDKINNENLTKCLQTLKELYADVETKHGLYCPNEAEFRAYMVLMNLNEGDTLREVQQLRPEVRDSADIRFAVKVYGALNSNNYVRFFRLIQSATFLHSCILHRYFNQIRSQGLRIIKKAYTEKGKLQYPVTEMIRLLGFEDAVEVTEFCSHYCLAVEGTDVILSRQSFVEPEASLPKRRSPTLVESKLMGTVGQVIYGGPLPALQLPMPFSSFDDDGCFIFPEALKSFLSGSSHHARAAITAEVREVDQPMEQRAEPTQASAPTRGLPDASVVARERMMYSVEAIRSMARTLFLEVIDEGFQEISREILSEEASLHSSIKEVGTDIMVSTVNEDCRTIANEVHAEETSSLKVQIEQIARTKQKAVETVCNEIVHETTDTMSREVADDEMRLVNQELRQQCLERCTHSVTNGLLEGSVNELIQDIAQEVYEVDVIAKQERLADTQKLVEVARCRRWLRIWRTSFLSCMRIKRAMLDFPSAPRAMSISDQIAALVPGRPDKHIRQQQFYISDRAKLSVKSPMSNIRQDLLLSAKLSMASAHKMLTSLRMWQPLDMAETVGIQLQREVAKWKEQGIVAKDASTLQWKLALSFPVRKKKESEKEQNLEDWLRSRLCNDSDRDKILEGTPSYEGEVLSRYSSSLLSQGYCQSLQLSVCIRSFSGGWNDTQELNVLKKDLLKGTSGLIFVTLSAEELAKDEAHWKKDRNRLSQMLKQKPILPAMPLVLVVPRSSGMAPLPFTVLDEYLGLGFLHDMGLLTAVHIAQPVVGSEDELASLCQDWSKQLSNCLRFLASNCPNPPELNSKFVSEFVEDAVVEYYKSPVYQDLRIRTRHQMLHHSPNTLLALYNEVIEHVAMVAASDTLAKSSWPAPEFDHHDSDPLSTWNSKDHLCDVYELISQMRLPYFRYSDLETDEWSSVCKDIWKFVNIITKKDTGSAKICLYHEVTELLRRTRENFDQFCWLASEDSPCEPSYVNMAWTDFIDVCIHYRMISLRTGHVRIITREELDDDFEPTEEHFREALIYFHVNMLEDWEDPQSWTDALKEAKVSEYGQMKPAVKHSAWRRHTTLMESKASAMETSESQPEPPTKTGATAKTSPDPVLSETQMTLNKVKEVVNKEKSETAKFEKTLNSMLQLYSPPDKPNLPNFMDFHTPQMPSRIGNDLSDEFETPVRRRKSCSATLPTTKRRRIFPELYGNAPRQKFIVDAAQLERSDSQTTKEPAASENHTGFSNSVSEEKQDGEPSLTERLKNLKQMIEDQYKADRLQELRLLSLMKPRLLQCETENDVL